RRPAGAGCTSTGGRESGASGAWGFSVVAGLAQLALEVCRHARGRSRPRRGANASRTCADRPDGLAGDHEVVEVQVQLLRGGPGATVVDVDPDRFDLEPAHVAEAEVGLRECLLAVDPGAEDAVFLTRQPVLARRV